MNLGDNFRRKLNGFLIHKDGFAEEIPKRNMIPGRVPHYNALHCNEDMAVSGTVHKKRKAQAKISKDHPIHIYSKTAL